MARRNMPTLKNALPHSRSSACPPSRLKAMRMVPRTLSQATTQRNSPASTNIETLPEASGITCHKKPLRPLPKLSLTSTKNDEPSLRGRYTHCATEIVHGCPLMDKGGHCVLKFAHQCLPAGSPQCRSKPQ